MIPNSTKVKKVVNLRKKEKKLSEREGMEVGERLKFAITWLIFTTDQYHLWYSL